MSALDNLHNSVNKEMDDLEMTTHSFADLRRMDVDELGELIGQYSVWKTRLEMLVGQYKSKAVSSKLSYEGALSRQCYVLAKEYEANGHKPPAEKLREGEVLENNKDVRDYYDKYITYQSQHDMMYGKYQSIETAYFSVQQYRNMKLDR